jgi:hypothetical protein
MDSEYTIIVEHNPCITCWCTLCLLIIAEAINMPLE